MKQLAEEDVPSVISPRLATGPAWTRPAAAREIKALENFMMTEMVFGLLIGSWR